MCGRTACTLSPDVLCKACAFQSLSSHQYIPAEWMSSTDEKDYTPSYNFAPTFYGPVMISKKLINPRCDTNERVIQPMLFGMIPPWHKGSPTKHKMTTNNCRVEGIFESKLYKTPLEKGKRCVVLCDGFYEWKRPTGKGEKQPYFIYFPQHEGIAIFDPDTWKTRLDSLWSSEKGWFGPKPLTIAGLFDTWKSENGTLVNSFSVITMDSCPEFSWIHERMPAVLETEEDINSWLDSANIPPHEAISRLKASTLLVSHPVSTNVGNVKNQGAELVLPVDITKAKPLSASGKLMSNWLKKGTPKMKEKLSVDVGPTEGVKRQVLSDASADIDAKPAKLCKEEKI